MTGKTDPPDFQSGGVEWPAESRLKLIPKISAPRFLFLQVLPLPPFFWGNAVSTQDRISRKAMLEAPRLKYEVLGPRF